MSNSATKPPIKDPSKIPTAEEVDRHLSQFSRYARMVRGAARVAGLTARLAWTHQGWAEQFRLDEAVLGTLVLVKLPPVSSIPVSKALEEALATRQLPEPLRRAIDAAEGSQVKWIETELTGPISGEIAAALIALKAELVRAGLVPLTAAERPKPVPRPEPEPVRSIARPPTSPPIPAVQTAPAPAAAAPISAPVRASRPAKPVPKPSKARAPKPIKAKAATKSKPAAKSLKAKKPAPKKPAKAAKGGKRR